MVPRQSVPTWGLVMYYYTDNAIPTEACYPFIGCVDANSDVQLDLLTAQRLERVRKTERAIRDVEGFGNFCVKGDGVNCDANVSPLPYFYGADLAPGAPDIAGGIAALDASYDVGGFYFVDREFDATNRTTVTRVLYSYGSPLKGFDNPNDRPEEQEALFSAYMDRYIELFTATDEVTWDAEARVGQLHLGSAITNTEINAEVERDIRFVVASAVGVLFVMMYQLRNPVLAVGGLLEALASYPLSFAAYHWVYGNSINSQINILAMYIVLGIGADDVFVMADAYRQSKTLMTNLGQIPEGDRLKARLQWAWTRAASAMTVTTLTTAVAFGVTGLSRIPALAAFGQLASIAVVVNFALSLSVFPSLLSSWHMYGSKGGRAKERATRRRKVVKWRNLFRKDKLDVAAEVAKVSPGVGEVKAAAEQEVAVVDWANGGVAPNVSTLPRVERFLHAKYAPFLWRFRFGVLGAFLASLVFAGAFAVQMRPASQIQSSLGEEHNIEKIARLEGQVYASLGDGFIYPLLESSIVFGAEPDAPIDRLETDDNDLTNLGVVVLDPSFAPATAAAQNHFSWVCDQLTAEKEFITPVVAGDPDECVWHAFEKWGDSQNYTFPLAEGDFLPYLRAFVYTTAEGQRHVQDVGFDDTTAPTSLDWLVLKTKSVLRSTNELAQIRVQYGLWLEEIARYNAKAAAGHNKAFMENSAFVIVALFDALVRTALSGMVASVSVAGAVLLVTLGPRMAALGIVSIASIVVYLLGFLSVMRYDFNIIESFALAIAVGVAVDYSVHLAHAFHESKAKSRYGRAQHALTTIGVSVMGGALSTLSATIPLTATSLLILSRFGLIFAVLIFLSFAVSFSAFIVLLMLLGPGEGGEGVSMGGAEAGEAEVPGSFRKDVGDGVEMRVLYVVEE